MNPKIAGSIENINELRFVRNTMVKLKKDF